MAHPLWGAAYSESIGSSVLALDERDAHLAAVAEPAPTAAKLQFERQELLRYPRAEEVEVDCHSLLLQNH